jgi:hypothetical protein
MDFPLDALDGHGSFLEIPQHSHNSYSFTQADLNLYDSV